jgi:NADPH:quinone reductase-like Zn-dependent oxidoreductase
MSTEDQATTLEINRTSIGETRLVSEPHRESGLAEGQARLRVDRFALTANNITYAVFGDMLGYWDFFPTGDDNFGRVPAMGWATVVESTVDDVAVGTRYYGWFPMASHVVFTPTPTADGFRDDGAHRQAHAPVYRAYVRTDRDVMFPAADDDGTTTDGEDRHALLRGLVLTGFLAEEFFADGGGSGDAYFGTSRVIVLSASSKTAIGFAQRASLRGGVEVVGVTSNGNREFVESLGFYDQVVSYDEIGNVATDGGAVSIDMAGNPNALNAVHAHFGDSLAYSMTVGRSHHDSKPDPNAPAMAGPTPQMFFAPSEVTRRQEDWGRAEYAERCADAIVDFAVASRDWLTVEHHNGAEAAQAAWLAVYAGSVAPSTGVIARIADVG